MSTEQAPAPGTRGPYRTGIARRREIVDAALTVFAQYGYHGGSLRTIAVEVGTTPATLISYFGSKEGLLVAVLQHWREQTGARQGSGPGLDFIRGFVPLMRYHTEHRGLIELFLTMSTEATNTEHPARPFILQRQQATLDDIARELRVAIEAGDIRPMSDAQVVDEARLMVATLDGIELQWLLDPEVDLVAIVDRHVNTAIARWRG